MLEKNFSLCDYLVFGLLLVASSMIGVFFAWRGRKTPSADQFFTGNRKLGLFPVTLSLVASFMSTNTLLGVPAEVYQVGTQFVMQNISIVVAIFLAAEVFMPVYHDLGLTSINEYLEKRFESKAIKLLGTIGFLLATMPYMAVVLYGPAVALASVTPLSISTSILVVGTICTFYTSIGGIKAVIWTDVLQCILMFMGVAIVIVQGVIELGGFENAFTILSKGDRLKVFNFNFDIYNHDNIWNVITGSTIGWASCYCTSQTQVQRYCSMKDKTQARRTLYYNLPGLIVLSLMSIMSGVVVYGKYYQCDPIQLGIIHRHDQLLPYYVMDTLGRFPGLPGLFVACVFSGSLSTLSSGFNALAAVTWEDLIKDNFPSVAGSNERTMRVVSFLALGYGLLAIGLSFTVGSVGTVMQASMSLAGSMTGPLFGLFLIAILFRFVNARGAMAGTIAGMLVGLFISMGSVLYPRPHISLPTTVANCSEDIAQYYLNSTLHSMPEFKFIRSYDNPEGLARLLHVSYLITPVLGFLTTICVCVAVSLITRDTRKNAELDNALFSPIARYFTDKEQPKN